MPKQKSKQTLVASSGSESDEPTPKKAKTAAKKPAKKSADENDTSDMFSLSRQRFVNVREFRGKVLIDIREYYEPEVGDLRPGKKGISLTVDQWRKLVNQIDEIDARIEEMA
ncbi:activated RNA polymerase II transcriptional coactivator p15-like [Lytechinus pictus]|uniref:activated RNA polymerase II transcriptional coactivator p15-like n=1 Tax=Lytechinus pictus TaxID=7653 RepID=UPI00240E07CD|nr:activated RNA polymerase II transcriptional coactivator p15-like [Lytechinus pictus]